MRWGRKPLSRKMYAALVPRNLKVLISTFALFELFDVLPCSSSPNEGVSLGLISVSLHTPDIIFAVRSRKSLC